ncbi:MAG: hypothetical protein JOY58_02460 [Solirubrobacterales bacterium]|nr:hypothetical protein [Solirubrobacterales bacterium]
MATSSRSSSARKSAAKPKTAGTRKTITTAGSTAPHARTPVEQVQDLAERAVLMQVGAGLLARDNLVSTVKGLAARYSTRSGFERELKRYERRGASARGRLEREARRTRTRVERELRQGRTRVERTVAQNRRRLEREVRSVRSDFGKQSEQMSTRVERLVANAQELLSATP